jgi:hypothetical protein
MMRRVLCLSVLVIAACASSKGSSAPPMPDQTIRIPAGGGGTATTLAISSSTSSSTKSLTAPAEKIWNVLPAVYDSLGIPVTDRDPASHAMGNSSFKVRRRIGNVPLSRYLDCGDTQGAPSADSYEILLSINSRVQPGEAGATTVVVTVDGMGRPIFLSSEYVHCGSKGGLEKRFFEVLEAELRR